MNFKLILLFLISKGLTLEWKDNGKVFQFCGDSRISGYYERFPANKTRRKMGEKEAEEVFNLAQNLTFLLYTTNVEDGGQISKIDLLKKVEESFK